MAAYRSSSLYRSTRLYRDASGAGTQYVVPSGFVSSNYGSPSIYNNARLLAPSGIASTVAFGTLNIYNYAQGATTVGIGPGSFGSPIVDQTHFVYPAGLGAGGVGALEISNYIRSVYPTGFDASSFGTTYFSQYFRYMYPVGTDTSALGTPFIENKTRYYNLIGWSSSSVSPGHHIWDGIYRVTNVTWGDTSQYSNPIVAFPEPPPTTDQYVVLSGRGIPIPDNQVWPSHHVESTIKSVFPDPILKGAVPSPHIDQQVFLSIRPLGQDHSKYGTPFVDQTIHVLYPEGIDSTYVNTHAQIYNAREDIIAGGFSAFASGAAQVYRGADRVYPSSVDRSDVVGSSTVWFRVRRLEPVGFDAASYGSPFVQEHDIYVNVGGIAPPVTLPSPIIDYKTKTLFPGGINTHSVPVPEISHDLRYIDQAGQSVDFSAIGAANIAFRNRTIYPTFILGPNWGVAHVYRHQYITVPGIASTWIAGFPELVIGTRKVPVPSLGDMAKIGFPAIYNYVQNVGPQGWYDTQWNFPVVFNLKREIKVSPFLNNVPPDVWPQYAPYVNNKNRELRPFGTAMSKYGVSALIYNNGAPIVPPGLDATFWGTARVEYKDRTVTPSGFDSFFNERYTVVWNAAKVLAPSSVPRSDAYGRPTALNLNRTVKYVGFINDVYGTPFIAYAIRTIRPSLFYDVPAAYPEVRLNPYPIAPVGIPQLGQVGGHYLYTYIREAKPASIVHDDYFGDARIENRNKTIKPYGYDLSEYGRPVIENYIKYVSPIWIGQELFGSSLIAQRNRTVYAVTISVPTFSVLHRIQKDSPDPPGPQYILLNNFDSSGHEVDGFGIAPPFFVAPSLRLATIYPPSVGQTTYGRATVVSNAILPRFIYDDSLVGFPTLIYDRTFEIQSILESSVVGTPSLSPHNIYAPDGDQMPFGYQPFQPNHHPMDFYTNVGLNGSRWPSFGLTTVTNQHRMIGPNGSTGLPDDVFGVASFTLRKRYVLVTGIRSNRFGQVIFLGVPQYVNLDDPLNHQGIPPFNQFGDNSIHYPIVPPDPNRYVYPAGTVVTTFGDTYIELFNREILVPGIVHSGGTSGTNPWGLPLVGYPRMYTISAGDVSLYGTAVIEYKNRVVRPVGWNNSSLEDGNFDDYLYRMEVHRKNPKVSATSVPPSYALGTPDVSHKTRTVAARGIDSYNAGRPLIGASATISCTGWDSSVFGDIDRWEAGKIKAHGDDLSTMGTPRILNPLVPVSISEFVMTSPLVRPGISVAGMPPIGFAGPSVTSPCGCNGRVVTPLTIVSTHAVPSPVVTT